MIEMLNSRGSWHIQNFCILWLTDGYSGVKIRKENQDGSQDMKIIKTQLVSQRAILKVMWQKHQFSILFFLLLWVHADV